jgi:hypothetical protein
MPVQPITVVSRESVSQEHVMLSIHVQTATHVAVPAIQQGSVYHLSVAPIPHAHQDSSVRTMERVRKMTVPEAVQMMPPVRQMVSVLITHVSVRQEHITVTAIGAMVVKLPSHVQVVELPS